MNKLAGSRSRRYSAAPLPPPAPLQQPPHATEAALRKPPTYKFFVFPKVTLFNLRLSLPNALTPMEKILQGLDLTLKYSRVSSTTQVGTGKFRFPTESTNEPHKLIGPSNSSEKSLGFHTQTCSQ